MSGLSGVSGPFADDPLSAVVNMVASHCASLGVFGKVNGHEPKSPPSTGRNPDLHCSVWVQRLEPITSGMAATSVGLQLNVRVYLPFKAEPQDAIDPTMLGAIHRICLALVADITLGGLVRAVDIRGIEGTAMTADAGHVELGGKNYRVMTLVVPVLVNDLWPESA